MALTPEGAKLTELHRLLQVRLSSQSMAATRLLWSSLDPSKGAAAMDAWLRQQVALSGVFDGKSAALAADYVQKFRAAEGFPGGPVVGVNDFDPNWAEQSLSYNGSNKVASLMGQGATAKEALARAAPNVMAAAQRLALGGGRRVVDQSSLANPDSHGWRRVSDGHPCAFCAMLVSRGGAYRSEKSAGIGRHWHKRCGCGVEEVFGDWTPTAREQQYVDAYTSARKELHADGRTPDQTNILEKMRLNGKFNDSPVPTPKNVELGGRWFSSKEDGAAWADKHWPDLSTYTPAQRAAVKKYQGSGHEAVNTALRKSDGNTGSLPGLDSAIDKAPRFPEDVVLTRSTGPEQFGLRPGQDPKSLVGKTFTERGYMSTSAADKSLAGGDFEMHIEVPKGAKWIYVSGDDPGAFAEIVLPRDLTYEIKGIHKIIPPEDGTWNGSYWRVDVKLL